jgi:hypothetical protein
VYLWTSGNNFFQISRNRTLNRTILIVIAVRVLKLVRKEENFCVLAGNLHVVFTDNGQSMIHESACSLEFTDCKSLRIYFVFVS